MTRMEKFKELRDSIRAVNEQAKKDVTNDNEVRIADEENLKTISRSSRKRLSDWIKGDKQ